MLNRVFLVIFVILSGCLSSTTPTDNDLDQANPVLFGLYEGIDTNIYSGKTRTNLLSYYRFHKDGTFQYVGLEALSTSESDSDFPMTQIAHPSIKYYMFFSRKGLLKIDDSLLKFSNLYSRWSGFDLYYTLSFWEPETSFSRNIANDYKVFSRELLVPKIGPQKSDSFFRRFKRIGDDESAIPFKYFGSEY